MDIDFKPLIYLGAIMAGPIFIALGILIAVLT